MSDIRYKISTAPLRLIARLPLRVLYILADVLYFLLCHVVRYRRSVILDNLGKCFPDLTERQRREVAKKFYRNFADNAVETLKLLHISDEEMRKRMIFEGVDEIESILHEGKSVIAYFSHCFNWEWATSFTLWCDPSVPEGQGVEYCQIYRPLRNGWFDRLMLEIRSRFHSVSIAKQSALRAFITYRREDVLTVTGFMSDQKPSHGDPTYVTEFLHRPTAMITGTETLGRRLGMAAVYWDMEKTARGHYRIVVRKICDDVSQTEPMEVTSTYTRMLQATVERDPALWLWSHKRWKNPVNLPVSSTLPV